MDGENMILSAIFYLDYQADDSLGHHYKRWDL